MRLYSSYLCSVKSNEACVYLYNKKQYPRNANNNVYMVKSTYPNLQRPIVDQIKIFKALSNQTRLSILLWLTDVEKNFEQQLHAHLLKDFDNGVCLGSIQKRAELSQSTISNYMMTLEDAGLVESQKIDKYTYFRLNKNTVAAIAQWLNQSFI
jgi:DNA-binding transcriptional ArsR family regulator